MPEEFRRDYLVRLPLPLAQLYRRAFNAPDARSRHDNTFYLFEALVKLAAAPLIAAYVRDLRQGGPRAEAPDRLLAHLALPSLGQWVAMLRELARHFGRRPDAGTHPLGPRWQQLDAPRRDLLAVLALYRRIKNGPDGQPAGDRSCSLLGLFDALVQYRNGVFGHGAGRFESFYAREMGPLLFPAANEVLAEGVLDPLGPPGSRLVHLTEVRTVDEDRIEVGLRELVGLEGERAAPLVLSKAQAAALLPNRVALLWPGNPVPLRLDPLLVYRESETADDLLFLNRDRNGRHVEYLSYTTGRTEQDPTTAPALAALLSLVVNRPVGEVELEELAQRSRLATPPVEVLPVAAPAVGTADGGASLGIRLEVTEGPHRGLVFSFTGHDTFLVGRSSRAHFRLPAKDEYFSRIHFMVEVNPPQCRLTDMGSKNGTCVNGQKAETADLKDGDLIKAGTTVLRVCMEAKAGVPEPAPPTPAAASFVTRTAPPLAVAGPGVASGLCPACAAPLAARGTGTGSTLCPACEVLAQEQPQSIKGYRIVRELGRGGMGVVHLAVRAADGTLVALKTITPTVAGTRAHVERFLREADTLRRLAHPNIVAFREIGESSGQLYFAMDYVRGTDAARLLKKEGGPLAVGRAVGLVCQLLEALAHAHAQGFVHRDVKPANVLVAEENGREVLRLADFGLARIYQASPLSGLTMRGEVGGTVAFMAPEQVTHFREAKPAADQYAAGATLYTLLTDRLVYDLPRDFARQIAMLLQDDPVPIQTRRPDLDAALAGVIHRSLAREPGSRFADAGALRQALLAFCRGG
jgi:serine/threonine-protein kinase